MNLDQPSGRVPERHRLRRFLSDAVVFCLLLVPSMLQAEAPVVAHLYPWGLQRGTSAELTIKGSWKKWPLKVGGTLPSGLKIELAEEAGKLAVEVAADVPPGIYYFRLHEQQGATKLIPLIVGEVKEIMEKEPNGRPGEGLAVELPAVLNGQLKESADVDIFRVTLKQGETLSLLVVANNILGVPMDAVIQVCDDRGFVLAQNDDERGLDPQLTYAAKQDGDFQIRLFAFPEATNSTIGFSSSADYSYRLTASKTRLLDFCLPLAVSSGESELTIWGSGFESEVMRWQSTAENPYFSIEGVPGTVFLPVVDAHIVVAADSSSVESPMSVMLPVSISGVIESEADQDVFEIPNLVKGESLVVEVFARMLGFPTDPLVEIFDMDGKLVSTQDDKDRATRDPAFSYKIPADGNYQIRIRDLHRFGGPRYAYRLEIKKSQPKVTLGLAAGEFIKTEEKLEIPVTITRTGGFDKELVISIEGLPEGIAFAEVKSAADGETAKAVTLILSGPLRASAQPITIVGSWEESRVIAEYAVEKSIQRRTDIWLTAIAGEGE